MRRLKLISRLLLLAPPLFTLYSFHQHRAGRALRADLISKGEICVSYDSKSRIVNHWKPRTEYGSVYCEADDAPVAAKGQPIGQLSR